MLLTNIHNEFAILEWTSANSATLETFDDATQDFLTTLMNELAHGNPKKLNKLAKKYGLQIPSESAILLFCYALDKSNLTNLTWLANFAKLDLTKLCESNTAQSSSISIENSFIPTLITSHLFYRHTSSVMINNLMSFGFNLNQQYLDGYTIFHYVTSLNSSHKQGHLNLVRALLDNGADPNIMNARGQSALKCAADGEIANYLVKQHECMPGYKNRGDSVAINRTAFKNNAIYEYCLQYGGIAEAISRIERKALGNMIPVKLTSIVNKPFSRRL